MGQSSRISQTLKNVRVVKKREKKSEDVQHTPAKPSTKSALAGCLPQPKCSQRALFTSTVNSETSSSSPWITFLSSLGLQPIPGPQQQARPATQEQPSAPPAPGTKRQDGQTFSGTNSAAWSQGQGYHQSPPGSPPQPNGHTCGYSCGAPHISQLLQAIISRLLHFSSVATRASVTFFCILAFFCILSSLPGFLIQSALYVVLATSLLLPLPTVLAGHLLYSSITFLPPLCALALLLP